MMNRLDVSLSRQISIGILNNIVEKILICIDMMRHDCECNSEKIDNNEPAIRDYLYCNYLNNDEVMSKIGFDNFRFHSEAPENYVDNKPIGRVDLQVYSIEEFRHRNRYFIFECKRVDGSLTLNRAYIKDGIHRFIVENPKYTSYYKANCMLGFIVKNINIDKNVDCINELLKKDYSDIHVHKYMYSLSALNTYMSSHGEEEPHRITLIHAFPNCSSIIKKDDVCKMLDDNKINEVYTL